MQGSSADAALGRIEAAIQRIESAAQSIVSRGDDLANRHERLKISVAETLNELDELIESVEP